MDLGLKGRTALVTGSSDGIGEEIALRLALEGADVIIHGKNREKVNEVISSISNQTNYEVRVRELLADATKPDEVNYEFKRIMSSVCKLDILVNNIGGVNGIKTFEEISDEEWLDTITFNLMTPVRFIRLALPYLKKSNQARIINLGSVSALQPGINNQHYLAAKAGLINLSKSLSNNFAKYNILVNTVCPSTIMGGAWHRDIKNISKNTSLSLQQAAEQLESDVKKKVPLNRVGTMKEVANAVVFLASQSASFINGECIFIDGGTKRSIS